MTIWAAIPADISPTYCGSLAGRISLTGDSVQQTLSIVLFKIAPVCADFCAALVILATVGWRLVTALGLFVLVAVGTLALFGQRGTPRHRAYADRAAEVGGALVDVLSNIWTVKAFSAHSRERRRFAQLPNIRYPKPEATNDAVLTAAKAARCDAFIHALPQGYATIVGERGAKLSGGQRQRLGIARALLKDAPIILLDEATSALDTEAEQEIQRALGAVMQGRTVLAIAHRLSTLAKFDRLVVLREGRIVEQGTPAELRRRRESFDQMCRLQEEGPMRLAS